MTYVSAPVGRPFTLLTF